jgi:hypothetical protein
VEKVKALLESGKSYHLSQLALKEVGFIKEVVNKYATMFRSASALSPGECKASSIEHLPPGVSF